jgi:hypothetical protein
MQLRPHALILAILALGLGAASQAGTVQVTLVHPENFTDAVDPPTPVPGTLPSLQALTLYLQALGQKYLPPDQTLAIDVLDVDLVGKLRPSRRTTSGWIRVAASPLDWPRIKLRYRLESNGKLLRSGEQSISDMAFAGRLGVGVYGDDPLRYEKRMLSDWFHAEFGAGQVAGR